MAGAFADERLIEEWARTDGIANVARELGATYAAVAQRAMRLRLRGVPLRRMPVSRRGDVTIATAPTPERLGIDRGELSDMLSRYREWLATDPRPKWVGPSEAS